MDQPLVPLKPEDVPEDLKCSICFRIPLTPAITPCEHVFCNSCLKTAIENIPKCPICRAECLLDDIRELEKGTFVYRIWSAILVECAHHEQGCCWVGTIADASSHFRRCMFAKNSPAALVEQLQRETIQLIASLEAINKEKKEINKEKKDILAKACNLEMLTMSLHNELKSNPMLRLPVLFDGNYNYDRFQVVKLSQLISRYLECKPDTIDRNRIFRCVEMCYRDLIRKLPDNPIQYYIAMRMLITTCAASTWFSSNQNRCLRRWMQEQQWE